MNDWRDLVFMVSGFIFAPSLMISIYRGIKLPASTSLPTITALLAMIVAYISLGYWLALSSTALTALCWIVLFLKRG